MQQAADLYELERRARPLVQSDFKPCPICGAVEHRIGTEGWRIDHVYRLHFPEYPPDHPFITRR